MKMNSPGTWAQTCARWFIMNSRHPQQQYTDNELVQKNGLENTKITLHSTRSGNVEPITRLDLRVGKIVSCEKHPDADSLYVEQVRIHKLVVM
jgi:tRNA-binding EMAP/Myf-like protein